MRLDPSDDRGAVAILVAILATVLFSFAAIVVDLGSARDLRAQAQDAADAAALAGLNALYPNGSATPLETNAIRAVKRSVYRNYLKSYYPGSTSQNNTVVNASWSASTGTLPGPACQAPPPTAGWSQTGAGGMTTNTNCILFSAGVPEQIQVILPSARSPVFLGGLVGYQGLDIDALAQAGVDQRTSLPACVFCVLGSDPHNFGKGNLEVTGGDIWINGSLVMSGGRVRTTGGGNKTYLQTGPMPDQVDDPNQVMDTAVADPLAPFAPDISTLSPGADPCGPAGRGLYGGLTLSGSGTCTMAPGTYVFTEPLIVGGDQKIEADDVTLVFACGVNGVVQPCDGTDAAPGQLVIQGSAEVDLRAPTSSANAGLAIYYTSGNTADLSFDGDAGGSVKGTIYGSAASLAVNSDCSISVDSLVVVADVRFGPSGCLKTSDSGSDNVDATVTTTVHAGLTK